MPSIQQRLHATVKGQGPRTLVFGNGFGTQQAIWAPIVQDLSADHRIVTFDIAGSSTTLPAWQRSRHTRLGGYAEDLVALIESVAAGPVSYIGHSMSAMAGVLAACAEPSLFERLVLLGASARYLDDPAQGYVGGFQASDVDQVVQAMSQDYAAWANGFSQAFMGNPDQPDLAAGFAQALKTLRADIALAVIDMVLRSDERDECLRLGTLGIPTLVMQTRQDLAVPQAASHWLAQALHARWLELDLEGHFPHLLDPALVTRHLRAFLD